MIAACEVSLVVCGAVVEDVEGEDAGPEELISLSVWVFSALVDTIVVVACDGVEVSVVIDEVASTTVVVTSSDVEVNAEVRVSVVVEGVTVVAVVLLLPKVAVAASVVLVEVSALLDCGTDADDDTGSFVVVVSSLMVAFALVVLVKSPIVEVVSSGDEVNKAVVVSTVLADVVVSVVDVVGMLCDTVGFSSLTSTHLISCT